MEWNGGIYDLMKTAQMFLYCRLLLLLLNAEFHIVLFRFIRTESTFASLLF